MLTDRHRIPKLSLLVAALVALCVWYAWQAQHHSVGYARCMSDPAAYDGHTVELALWRVESVEPEGYHIGGPTRSVPVLGPSAGLEPGWTISVVGRFDARQEALVEQWREVHHSRRHKAALGLLGLLSFVGYAGYHFRWRDGRLVLRA